GDGGGGTFVWVPTSVSPLLNDDEGIAIRLDPGSTFDNQGYFNRLYSGPINVRWFGAIVGATDPNPPIDPATLFPYTQPIADVTPYVHRARDYAEGGTKYGAGTVYFPKGIYPGAF